MKSKFSAILKLFISLTLILTIICPGYGNTVSIAEGEVISSERFAGSVEYNIEGKAYSTPQSEFMLNYEIKNEGTSNIQVRVEETLYGEGGVVESGPKSTSWEPIIEAGQSKSFSGNPFKAKKVSTYTLGYKIEYRVEGSDQWNLVKNEEKQISTISTNIDVKYKTKPSGKVSVGKEVVYTAELSSKASVNIENILVSDSVLGDIGVIPVLAPGTTASVSKTFKMNQTTKSHVILKFDDPTGSGESIVREMDKAAVEVVVEQEQIEKPLVISGKVNKTKIAPNEEVDFSLSVGNKGNRPLTNVKLVDWTGKEVLFEGSISPGKEKTVIRTSRVEPGKNYEFKATAVEEGTGRNVEASYTAKFTGIEAELEITNRVTPDDIAVGDIVTIEYSIKNTGKTTMVDIMVNEPEFGEVGRFDELKPGGGETFSIEKIVEEDTKSHPRVTAKDKGSGHEYEFQGDLIEITINTIEAHPLLTMKLTSDPKVLTEAGNVDIICTVINDGDVKIDNIELILNERELNIGSILTLEPGDQETLTLPGVSIEGNTTFTVTAKGVTYDGEEVEFVSEPYEVEIGEDIPEEPKKNPKLSFLKKLLGVIVALAIATVGGMVYLIRDLRRGGKKKVRIRRKNANQKN